MAKKERPQKQSQKPKTNRPKTTLQDNWVQITATIGLFVTLFAVMIIHLTYFTATSKQEMFNNSYNSRQELLLSRNYRGTIYSRDGDVLAETVLDGAKNEIRVYPYGNLFSHVVGYSTQGRMGVEALANYYLLNTSISLSSKVENSMAGVKNPGDKVYTTLDVEIQKQADTLLGQYQGAIVMTEVKTGRVLAMVSHPNFDPNEIVEIWDSLIQNEDSSVLVNRATQGLYPPGSTFKIVTALEYIRQNPDTYDRYTFSCDGYYSSGTGRINCYHGTSHGRVDFTASFAKSCNAAFANIGMSLDRDQFQQTLNDLLFDGELPISLRYAKSSIQISKNITDSEMMQTYIGQGKTQITPMHLNMLTCAIANDGVLMEPLFIDRVESAEEKVVKTFRPQTYGRLMSQEEAEILQELMTAVVTMGTASRLDGQAYTAAGKTGSAEYNNIKGDSHAWFTGFAPADDPEVCVTIIVEGAGSGGEYAVPIARRLFDCYFMEKENQEELQ
ncbi:MAG: penicillin-binding protein 2 [Acetatifactor sp.]|nr:penicillin-binding protein 2 [Acetatifactor sp.]